jgi:hypothetical protein
MDMDVRIDESRKDILAGRVDAGIFLSMREMVSFSQKISET